MAGKFLESAARQPELIPVLQVRMFITAGLIDAAGPGAAHIQFLKADDVRLQLGDHVGDARDVQLTIDADAAMDIIGDESGHGSLSTARNRIAGGAPAAVLAGLDDNQTVGDFVDISGPGRKLFRQNLTAQGDGLFQTLDRSTVTQGGGQGGHGIGPDFGADA